MAVDVNNWYRGVLGRDADPGGRSFWETQLKSSTNPEDVYKTFQQSAVSNGEVVNGAFKATDAYVAPKSVLTGGDGSTLTDEWAVNNGVKLDAAAAQKLKSEYEIAAMQGAKASTDLYAKFLKDNNVTNGAADYITASRFGTAKPVVAAPAAAPAAAPQRAIQGATEWKVDPKTQTVAGQLESVLASDSPLMQQARTRALQQQNAGGRLNSTMAQSAADSAMYDAALQIATPDAGTYAKAGQFNADSTNTFARDSNAQTYNLETLAKQNDYQTARDATLNGYQADRDSTLNSYDVAKVATAAANTKDIANIEATYKNLTQGSASATSIMNNMQSALTTLANNTAITDPAVRETMAADIKSNATTALNMVGALAGNVDIAAYIRSLNIT